MTPPLAFTVGKHVTALDFLQADERLAALTIDQHLFVWDLRTSQFADGVCTVVSRNLTSDEWARYIGPRLPYEKTCPGLDEAAQSAPSR